MNTLLIGILVAWVAITTTLYFIISSIFPHYKGFGMWLVFTCLPIGLAWEGIRMLFKKKI